MAHGLITSIDMPVGVNTVIYTMPVGKIQVFNVNISNRNDEDVKIRLALVGGGLSDLTDADYLEFDTILRANGVIERTGIALNGEQSLIGYSNKGNVSFVVFG